MITAINNIKTILIVLGIAAAIWFFKDWQHQKAENIRQTENNRQLRHNDSLNYSQQLLNKSEIIDYLEYDKSELKNNLSRANIKLNRIERIITQKLEYKDTVNNDYKIEGIIAAIKDNRRLEVPVLDSTKCMVIRGSILYDGKELSLNIKERNFKNVSDVVTYWERRQWSLLGIKTRLFGKKQVTVKIFNSCGKTETKVVERK